MDEFEFDLDKKAETPDVVHTASSKADDKMRGIIGKVSRWRSIIVMGVMGIISLIWPFMAFGFVNPFSVDFLVNAIYSLVVATTCYSVFTSLGTKAERAESLSYRDTRKEWLRLSQKIKDEGLMRAFSEFCNRRRTEERKERRAWLVDEAGYSYDEYEEKYAKLSEEDIDELRKKGELTKKQAENLKLANGPIEVKPIHTYLILSGTKFSNINEVGREQKKKVFDVIRPITLLVTIFLRGILDIAGGDGMGVMDFLAFFVATLFIILTWSLTGFRYGVSVVCEEEHLMKGRAEFIQMFLEDEKDKKPPAVEGGGMLQDVLDNIVQM